MFNWIIILSNISFKNERLGYEGWGGSVILVQHNFSIIRPAKHNFEHNTLVSRVAPESIILYFSSIIWQTLPHPLDSISLQGCFVSIAGILHVKLLSVTFYLLKKSTTVSKNKIKTILWKHDRASWELYNALFLFFKVRGSFTNKRQLQTACGCWWWRLRALKEFIRNSFC